MKSGLMWGKFRDGIYLLQVDSIGNREALIFCKDEAELDQFIANTREFRELLRPNVPESFRKAFGE